MTAEAPAAAALAAFTEKLHEPRCTSAMLPTGKPAKSAASHAEVLPLAGPGAGTTRSTAVTGAVTSPFGE